MCVHVRGKGTTARGKESFKKKEAKGARRESVEKERGFVVGVVDIKRRFCGETV